MSKPARIYTRTGDDGETGLVGGMRLPKHAPRIEAYGCVDEASSRIGIARAAITQALRTSQLDQGRVERVGRRLDAWLSWTQHRLFDLGSDLATPDPALRATMPQLADEDVTALERAVDEAERDLQPLTQFILPAGSIAGAALHLARCGTRNAERRVTALAEAEFVETVNIRFLNRLSDALFVWARWMTWAQAEPETVRKRDAVAPEAV